VILTVSIIVLIFLWHIPSALIPIITIPLRSCSPSSFPHDGSRPTSCPGRHCHRHWRPVDAAIVVVEQTHKNLEQWEQTGRKEDYKTVVVNAVKQVAGTSFFALLVIAVSFLPVLTLRVRKAVSSSPCLHEKSLYDHCGRAGHHPGPALRLLLTHMKNFNFRPSWLCKATNAVVVERSIRRKKHRSVAS